MRKLLFLLLVFGAAFVGWYYFSPIYTLSQMKSAAESKDAGKLSAYVDYGALRADLKDDLRRTMTNEVAGQSPTGIAAIGSAFAMAMLDPMIDAMVTPDGVEAMLAQGRPKQPADSKTQPNSKPERSPVQPPVAAPAKNPVIERNGLSEFRVRSKDPNKGAIVFRRRGLGWKMVGVDLPQSPIRTPAGS
jgi:hypothetical protein